MSYREQTNENRETVSDILAEMRERADAMQTHGTTHGVRLAVLEFAIRIEAAWEREARAIATENAVLPAVCITKKKRRRTKTYDPAKTLHAYWRDHYEV